MIDTKNIYNVLDGVTAIFCRHDPARPELTAHLEIGRTYTVYAMSGQRTFSKLVLKDDEQEYSSICFHIYDNGLLIEDWAYHPRYMAPYLREEILRGEYHRIMARWRRMGWVDPVTGEPRLGPPCYIVEMQAFIAKQRCGEFQIEMPYHICSAIVENPEAFISWHFSDDDDSCLDKVALHVKHQVLRQIHIEHPSYKPSAECPLDICFFTSSILNWSKQIPFASLSRISEHEVLLVDSPRYQIFGVKGSIFQEKNVDVVALFEYIGLATFRVEMKRFLTERNMPSDKMAFFPFGSAPAIYYSPERSCSLEDMLSFVSSRGYTSVAMNGVRMGEFSELRNLKIISDWLERHPESSIRTVRLVDLRGGFCKVHTHR